MFIVHFTGHEKKLTGICHVFLDDDFRDGDRTQPCFRMLKRVLLVELRDGGVLFVGEGRSHDWTTMW